MDTVVFTTICHGNFLQGGNTSDGHNITDVLLDDHGNLFVKLLYL